MSSPDSRSYLTSKQRGLSFLEFILVVVVIGILTTVALHFLKKRVEQAEQASLQAMSRNFTASMSMLRNKWIVEGNRMNEAGYRTVLLDQDTIYLNEAGWPLGTDRKTGDTPQTAKNCWQLWQVIMQNNVPATVGNRQSRGDETYHISAPEQQVCRYELARFAKNIFYFDYRTTTGKVTLHMPSLPLDEKKR